MSADYLLGPLVMKPLIHMSTYCTGPTKRLSRHGYTEQLASLGEVLPLLSWPFCNLDPMEALLRAPLIPRITNTPGKRKQVSPRVRAKNPRGSSG